MATKKKYLQKSKEYFKQQNEKFKSAMALRSEINTPLLDFLVPLNAKRASALKKYEKLVSWEESKIPDKRNFFSKYPRTAEPVKKSSNGFDPMSGDIFPGLSGRMVDRYIPYGGHSANLVYAPFDFEEDPQPLVKKSDPALTVLYETNFLGLKSPDKVNGIVQGHVILDMGSNEGESGIYLRQSIGFNYAPSTSGFTEITIRDRDLKAVVMWANIGSAKAINGEAFTSLVLQIRIMEGDNIINSLPYDNLIGAKNWVGENLVIPYGVTSYPFYTPDSIYIDSFKRIAGVKYKIWIDAYLSASVKGVSSRINVSYGLNLSPVEIIEY